MTTHVNPVPTLVGLGLLAVAWRLGVFADEANRRAALVAGGTGLLLIPVMEYTQLRSPGNYVQLAIVVGIVAGVTATVRFGDRLRAAFGGLG